jgi:hypothetical protein
VDIAKKRCYIVKTAFKVYLNELQISTREFEFAVKEMNILKGTAKIRMSTGWKSGMGAAPSVYAYEFALQDEDIRNMIEVASGEA